MDELKKKYALQSAEYEGRISDALRKQDRNAINKIKALNIQISKTLEEMIGVLTQTKKDSTGSVKTYRDDLIVKLHQIQRDYNGLLKNTDTLETLRRIRSTENAIGRRQLNLYFIFFFGLVLIILLFLLFFGQKKDSAAMTPSTPAMTPPLI